ncbi:putative 3-deoxy-D-arabinoheptulosonate-7-phosphate synthase [Actinoplanes missouriensis 431]|uniref:Phospho-2-dehydro-3-deoxyheptonate aldolase n=1 Tax=Actinoplanes missouriensis (strain ATCC 14538 / DSM 43046 / CBS 188.64 / JCM 3121 / NBRC 102363 / NCIMB 12654 / NRRL B-3342 / UNCC 431) TaxID=512565 RepID=I0GY94_ACTM4|nr:3-deoxy-7-phosphoheptulonate synthase [Actinoplanes missouriensis]BAL85731.1 putative 3-deoxy-D-arabinoheptulosonate-7-phosphate synthase [Actinoplanes missouriensis 431]
MTAPEVQRVRDQRIEKVVPLMSPALLHHELPLTPALHDTVLEGRKQVEDVLNGRDQRLLVVVGPCSVHDPIAAGEYADLLRTEAERLSEDLLIVMRVYFEKPRSTVGWKGLIMDPALDGSGDVGTGLRVARKLLLEVVGRGLPVAVEFLDPITPQYIADTVAWGAIGARTVESQVHRQLSSGLSMPIGMKNRPDGSVSTAVDAIQAAAAQHVFPGIDYSGTPAILHTTGNPDCHLVLRGGGGKPNYSAADVAASVELLRKAGLPERLVIDCSHGNSNKDHMRQPIVAEDIAAQMEAGQTAISGVMLESFIEPGRQDLGGDLTYGQSVTDACMGWDATVAVLERLAAASAKRRHSL